MKYVNPGAGKGLAAKVLFVDDEQAILDGIRRALTEEDLGWEMTFLSDPLVALDSEVALTCDVIVTDLRMPALGGLDLIEKLRAKGMVAEAIILTGTGDLTSAMDAINRVRVFRYYTKPCRAARLAEGIADGIQLRKEADTTAAIADLLPFAILGVDAGRRITFVNREGAKLMAAGGGVITDAGGRCRAATREQTAALVRAIDAVLGGGDPVVLGMTDITGEKRYSVLVDHQPPGGQPSVFLFLMDLGGHPVPSAEALKSVFDLSNSEARLAHGFASGLDIKQIAERMGITVHTARTYLKTLFDKTGTNRQAELVRMLITAFPAVLPDRTA